MVSKASAGSSEFHLWGRLCALKEPRRLQREFAGAQCRHAWRHDLAIFNMRQSGRFRQVGLWKTSLRRRAERCLWPRPGYRPSRRSGRESSGSGFGVVRVHWQPRDRPHPGCSSNSAMPNDEAQPGDVPYGAQVKCICASTLALICDFLTGPKILESRLFPRLSPATKYIPSGMTICLNSPRS
jgi:hypothetical protein